MTLAARGARETDTGTEPIHDQALVAALRKRMVHVYARSTVLALVLSVIVWFLPA